MVTEPCSTSLRWNARPVKVTRGNRADDASSERASAAATRSAAMRIEPWCATAASSAVDIDTRPTCARTGAVERRRMLMVDLMTIPFVVSFAE
jgi:hypothetical protein